MSKNPLSPLILAIDQGTTGTKALLVDESLNVVAEAYQDFEQHFPKPSWVEHDAGEIWDTVLTTIKKVTQNIESNRIAAIGITNQRETVCFWDRETGTPLSHALVWQDRRTTPHCEELKAKGAEPFITEKTGLLIDPYFSGTKVAYALEHFDQVKQAQASGKLAVGTIDSYLCARFAGGGVHVTEPSNACRTLCFHLTEHQWDSELCSTLGIPKEVWPEVLPSVGTFTKTRGVPGLPDGIPITGILGDQQSALLGQACLEPGTAKCTYGTGSFILANTGSRPAPSKHRMLTTIGWQIGGETTYALEGSAFIAGAAVQWLRDGLGIIKSSSEVLELAQKVDSSDGVHFVPALTGLGAPYWDPNARGIITGLTRGSTAAHLARATLEGIAFQNADLLMAMQKDVGKPLQGLNVDGGASVNNLLMQFQADILGVKLRRPKMKETTVLGAVFAAGLGIGLWKDLDQIKTVWQEDASFEPSIEEKQRESLLAGWHHAVAQAQK